MKAIPIITFHSVDRSGSVISISPEQLQTLLDFLEHNRFKTLTMRGTTTALQDPADTSRAVALTFDDGFENFYTEVFPRLQVFKMKATVFVVTQRCGRTNNWDQCGHQIPELPLLTWSQIEELSRYGMEIGSHSSTHLNLAQISDGAMQAEILDSKKMIEDHLGRATLSFAYPYGAFNLSVKAFVREHFFCGLGTRLAVAHPGEDLCQLSRIDSYYLKNNPATLNHPMLKPYLAIRRWGRTVRMCFR